MDLLQFAILVYSFRYCCRFYVYSRDSQDAESANEKIEFLVKRIESLERRNEAMEMKIAQMDGAYRAKERMMNENIIELKRKYELITQMNSKREVQLENNLTLNMPETLYTSPIWNDSWSLKKHTHRQMTQKAMNSKAVRREHIKRQTTETHRVAFFATVTPHDMPHLGENQNIIFDKAQTNIGNAYNARYGFFTAPMNGIYVFSVTLAGQRHVNHFYAHIDVNGQKAAKMVYGPGNITQTAHTIIVQLKSTDEVSVKNDKLDDYILGDNYSSFSGFLLFQQDTATPQVVGK